MTLNTDASEVRELCAFIRAHRYGAATRKLPQYSFTSGDVINVILKREWGRRIFAEIDRIKRLLGAPSSDDYERAKEFCSQYVGEEEVKCLPEPLRSHPGTIDGVPYQLYGMLMHRLAESKAPSLGEMLCEAWMLGYIPCGISRDSSGERLVVWAPYVR